MEKSIDNHAEVASQPLTPSQRNDGNEHTTVERFRKWGRLLITNPYTVQAIFPYVGIGVAIFLLIFLPLHTFRAIIRKDDRPDEVAFTSAAVFVMLTLILSTRLIYSHLSNWYMPDVQKYVVRILFMVPIYSVQSWLSLRFQQARIYIDTLRDLYEALVIQSFLYYLMELLGGEDSLIQLLHRKDARFGQHEFIFQYFFPPWDMGLEFARQCKHGVLQYVVVKACTTLVTAILQPLHLYGEGQFFDPTVGYPYISFCLNLSQMWALYCLIKFYHATHVDLRQPIHWHPLRKFLCIKGVVFFTWWQGIGITYLKSRNIINTIGNWDKNQVANGIQDYLICSEMFFFAIAHMISFSHLECIPSSYEMRRNKRHDHMDDGNTTKDISSNRWKRWMEYFQPLKGDKNELVQSLLDDDRMDHNHDDHDTCAPRIKTLDRPGAVSDAFWTSTVPHDTLKEVKRFRHDVLSSRKSAVNLHS